MFKQNGLSWVDYACICDLYWSVQKAPSQYHCCKWFRDLCLCFWISSLQSNSILPNIFTIFYAKQEWSGQLAQKPSDHTFQKMPQAAKSRQKTWGPLQFVSCDGALWGWWALRSFGWGHSEIVGVHVPIVQQILFLLTLVLICSDMESRLQARAARPSFDFIWRCLKIISNWILAQKGVYLYIYI